MKTVYLALGLLLLPGMLWAQGSEKENEFTMSMQSDPVQNTVTEHSYHVSRETRLLHLSTTVHVFPWSINVRI